VASTDVTVTRPRTSDRMFSVQVTQASPAPATTSTFDSVKLISAVFAKIVSHDARTAVQPTRSGQPGWTHFSCSPCAHTRSIAWMSSVSNAR